MAQARELFLPGRAVWELKYQARSSPAAVVVALKLDGYAFSLLACRANVLLSASSLENSFRNFYSITRVTAERKKS
jgi:hypothetical protein